MKRKSLLLASLTVGTLFAFGFGGCIQDVLFLVAPFLT